MRRTFGTRAGCVSRGRRGTNEAGVASKLTVPRFHVQQEVDNFWSTEKRNERWQCAQAAIHGRVQDRSHQAVGLGGWPRGRAKAGNSLSDVEQLVAQAQAGGLGAFA